MTYGVVAIARTLDEARPMLTAAQKYATLATVVVNGDVGNASSDGLVTVVERPWVNFGHNRSEAFALARGTADWLLALDADMTVEIENLGS